MLNKARVALPAHFSYEYPMFVRFLELYYEWKDGKGDVSPAAFADVLAGGQAVDDHDLIGPGGKSARMAEDHHLERSFQHIVTSDNQLFVTRDDRLFATAVERTESLNAWYADVAFPRIRNTLVDEAVPLYRVDEVRFLKLIRDIGQIRGTAHATKLFFKLVFNEDVEVEYPRDHIAVIDEGFTLDATDSVIRDDHLYDEFAYVVRVERDPEFYMGTFDSIYREFVHAGGFTPFVKHHDDVITSAMGPELITNGTFDVSIDGWETTEHAVATHDSGKLKLATTVDGHSAYQVLTGLTVGSRYSMRADIYPDTATAEMIIHDDPSGSTITDEDGDVAKIQSGDYSNTVFVATGPSVRVSLTNTSLGDAYFDQVTLSEMLI